MDWLLNLLRGRRRPRLPIVCYLRENGPIAYGTDVFSGDPRERAEAMISTGLTWYWKTRGPVAPARDWTHLTRWSLAALLADLAEPNPTVILVGVDDTDQETHEEITDGRVAAWVRGFAAATDGPLHAVVSRSAIDGDLLFVAQQPPQSIRTMLHAWGISRDKAERKSYARLHGRALEDLLRTMS